MEIEELARAIRNLSNGKVCGLDGLLIGIYKFFWKDLKRHMFEQFIQIEKDSKLHLLATRSVITLLQKTNHPPLKIGSYRPLSLTCTEYKVYVKILAVRLKVVLQEIIHPDQTEFLSGRLIRENINKLLGLLHHCFKYQIPAILTSVVFEKAFDKVSWDALYRIMEDFNIGPKY